MIILQLHLTNFKNISSLAIDFSPFINCLVGENGSGKTNLLDAIHYICISKSTFNSSDQSCIQFNEDFFRLVGDLQSLDKVFTIESAFGIGVKKILKVNGSEYDKNSDHIGRFPIVVIAPDDTDLIREGSEMRRKFFDSIICQINKEYLEDLMSYNYILKQRNALLKRAFENKVHQSEFEPYDVKLISLGKKIFQIRLKSMEQFLPIFEKHYAFIASSKEKPEIKYESDLEDEDFEKQFYQSFSKDFALQRTTRGIHGDDFSFLIDQNSIKKTGSQGAKKILCYCP